MSLSSSMRRIFMYVFLLLEPNAILVDARFLLVRPGHRARHAAVKTDLLDTDTEPRLRSAYKSPSIWHWNSLSPGLPDIESMMESTTEAVNSPWHVSKIQPMSISLIRTLHHARSYSSMVEAVLILFLVVGLIVACMVLANGDDQVNPKSGFQRIKASPPLSVQDLQFAMEGC